VVPWSPAEAGRFPVAEILTVLAAELVGTGQRALDGAVSYAKERRQFGRPIGSFQAIKHMLADRYVQLDAARLLVHTAAADPGSGPATELAARARLPPTRCRRTAASASPGSTRPTCYSSAREPDGRCSVPPPANSTPWPATSSPDNRLVSAGPAAGCGGRPWAPDLPGTGTGSTAGLPAGRHGRHRLPWRSPATPDRPRSAGRGLRQ